MKKRIILIVLLVGLIGLVAAGVGIYIRRNTGEGLLRRVRLNLYYSHKFEEARHQAERYVRSNPDDPEGRHLLGLALTHLGFYGEARRELEKARQLSPGDAIIVMDLANTWRYEARKPLTAGGTASDDVYELSDTQLQKAVALLDGVQPSEASDRLNVMNLRGQLYYDKGQIRSALDALLLRQVELRSQADPLGAERLRERAAQSRERADDALAQARDELLAVVLEDPERPEAALSLVLICERLREAGTLAQVREKLLAMDAPPPLATMHLVRIGLDEAQGHSDDAYRAELGGGIESIERLLAGNPSREARVEIRALLSRLLFDAGRFDEARDEAARVLALQQGHPEARLVDSLALFHMGRAKEAEDRLYALQIERPNYVAALYHYGVVAMAGENTILGRRALHKLVDDHPQHSLAGLARGKLADAYFQEGIRAEAFVYARAYRESRLNDPLALLSFVRTAIAHGQRVQAEEALGDALGRIDGNIPLTHAVARGYALLGNREKAAPLFDRVIDADAETLDGRIAQAQALVFRGRHPEAESILHEQLQAHPENARLHYEQARLYDETGRSLLSLEHYEKAAERQRQNIEYRIALARAYLDNGRFEACERLLDELPASNTLAGELRYKLAIAKGEPVTADDVRQITAHGSYTPIQRAQALLRGGHPLEAIKLFGEELGRDPGSGEALAGLGRAHLAVAQASADEADRREHLAKGTDALQRRLRLFPEQALAYIELANALAVVKNPDEVGEHIRQAAIRPLPGLIDVIVGGLWKRFGEPQKAGEALLRALNDTGASDHLRGRAGLELAQVLAATGSVAEAFVAIDRVADAFPEWRYSALLSKADLLIQRNRPDEAVSVLTRLRDTVTEKRDDDVLRKVASRFVRMGNADEALTTLDTLEGLTPGDARVNLLRASAYAVRGQTEDVLDQYRQVIEKQPGNVAAYTQWVRALDGLQRRGEALAVLEQMASQGESLAGMAMIEKARLQMRWGLPGEAVKTYEALQGAGIADNPRIRYALGQAFAARGRTQRAREEFEQVSPFASEYMRAQTQLILLAESHDDKLAIARELRHRFPDRKELLFEELRLLLDAKRASEAAGITRQWLADNPDRTKTSMQMAVSCLQVFIAARDDRAAIELCNDMAPVFSHNVWRHIPALLLARENDPAAGGTLPSPEQAGFSDAVLGLALAVRRGETPGPWASRIEAIIQEARQKNPDASVPPNVRLLIAAASGDPQAAAAALTGYEAADPIEHAVAAELVSHVDANPQAARLEAAELLLIATAFDFGLSDYGRQWAGDLLAKRPSSQWAASLAMQHGDDTARDAVLAVLQPDDSLLALTHRAAAAFGGGDFARAADLYDRAADALPRGTRNTPLLLRRAIAHEYAGNTSGALAQYRDIWEQTGEPSAANNAAFLAATLSPNDPEVLESSLGLIEQALKKRPSSAAFQNTCGWIMYRLGSVEDAARILRIAIVGLADLPEAHYRLGVVEQAAGQAELARWHLQAAIDHAERMEAAGAALTPSAAEAKRQAAEALAEM